MENFSGKIAVHSFPMTEKDARLLNPQVLAFVGDAVYTLYIRTELAANEFVRTNTLHIHAAKYVNATAQSEAAEKLLPHLNEDESYIYKRGRNVNTSSVAKNAKISDYRKATGFEALLGFLYLTDKKERLNEIMQMIFKEINKEE